MGTIMTLNIVLILLCRMEFHMGELKKICRVCGRRFKKAKKERERSYECKDYIKELAEVFCIDVSSDHEDIHPLLFCLSCLTVIKKWHTNRGGKVPPVARLFEWSKHDGSECRVSVVVIYLILSMRHSCVVIYCSGLPSFHRLASRWSFKGW